MIKRERVGLADEVLKNAQSETDDIMRGDKPFVQRFIRDKLEEACVTPKHTPFVQQVTTATTVKMGIHDEGRVDMRQMAVLHEHLIQQYISAIECEHFRQLCIELARDRITDEQIEVVERVVRQLIATKRYHEQQEMDKLNTKVKIYERYLKGIKDGAMIDGVENPKYLAELAFRETEMKLRGLL